MKNKEQTKGFIKAHGRLSFGKENVKYFLKEY